MPRREIRLRAKRLPHAAGLEPPAAASSGSSGLDLRAAIDRPMELEPGERRLVPTGWIVEIPAGWEGQVRPRSGLALRQGLTVANAPGTIDSDYRGELGVILIHLGNEPVTIERGDRIAQLVIAPVAAAAIDEVEELEETARGGGWFGSTGVE